MEVSVEIASRGLVHMATFPAIPMEEFIKRNNYCKAKEYKTDSPVSVFFTIHDISDIFCPRHNMGIPLLLAEGDRTHPFANLLIYGLKYALPHNPLVESILGERFTGMTGRNHSEYVEGFTRSCTSSQKKSAEERRSNNRV